MKSFVFRMQTWYGSISFGPEGTVFLAEGVDVMKCVGGLFLTNLTRPGDFGVLTATHTGYVNVVVRSYSVKPDTVEDTSAWEDMALGSFVSPEGDLVPQTPPETLDGPAPNLVDGPGTYAVRVLARGRDDEPPEDLNETGPDSYLIEIWPITPEEASEDAIITSETAKGWAEAYRSGEASGADMTRNRPAHGP